MSPKKTLSIIFVNFKSALLLRKCLVSLKKAGILGNDKEVIIVNNDAKEDPDAILRDLISSNFVEIKIVNHKKNVGFGAGMNIGSSLTRGEFLWFLNPDCEMVAGKIDEVLNCLREGAGVLGTKLLDREGGVQEWTAGKETNILDLILNNFGFKRSKKIWESRGRVGCDWVSGGSFFVKKEIFAKLGGFDENFFMYFEDMDFCRRARLSGEKIIFCPDFVVKHFGGGSYLTKSAQKKHFYASQDYYFDKNHKWSAPLVRFLRKLAFK